MPSVYNFSTVRWLEKHHKKKKVSTQNLNERKTRQLKEMFDHLDADKSGTIEVQELDTAVKVLGIQHDHDIIMEQFAYMDADRSGSIDFEEFVAVMTSDVVDQDFFQLKDEQEASKWNMAFFTFASSFRRMKIVDKVDDVHIPDSQRVQHFKSLFEVPMFSNSE